jgi:uroporphyrinogen decarboxylase
MHNRRSFVAAFAAAVPSFGKTAMTSRERVDRALAGKDLDRPPFSLWHHFGLESQGPKAHAARTLEFHRVNSTDLVKVMSDFPYPKPAKPWELRVEASPFAPQLEALRIIRDGLKGEAHFVETIFNPWNVAEKLTSKEEVQKLKREQPEKLLAAIEVIARSEANHARRAIEAGASGIFLAIANADSSVLSREDYLKFSAPFDRMVLDAARSAPLNVLHIHGSKVYLDLFEDTAKWPGAAVVNYSVKSTGVPFADFRRKYKGVLMGGIDEVTYRTLAPAQLRQQANAARAAAGKRFILAPGCSVPDQSLPDETRRMSALFS